MILTGGHQPFASPEEALAHYGVKGMHWGVRKEYEAVGRSAAKGASAAVSSSAAEAYQRALLETVIGRPIGADISGLPRMSTTGTSGDSKDTEGMSGRQKALIGLGVLGVVAGGSYFAYSRYKRGMFFPGGGKPNEWDVSGLKHGPLSDVDLVNGGFSAKYPLQGLKSATADIPITDYYNIDHSKGYANYIPKDGYKTAFAKARHEDLMSTFDEMRTLYPSVRNLKVEMVPMSEVPGMDLMNAQGAIAAVMPLGKGEARIMYNDTMSDFGSTSREAIESFVPGMFKNKYVGYHEMGHILAVANGDMPPLNKFMLQPDAMKSYGDVKNMLTNNIKYGAAKNIYHKDTFAKHGFSFEELSKLGGYAATQPAESMAELFGHYAHPEMRRRLTPEQREKAHKMFNKMGGVT